MWNYFDKNKEAVHTDGYICITEEIFFHFGFMIQVLLFKSKSPFCNWAWAFKEFGLVLFSTSSFRVSYNKDIFMIFPVANLPSDCGAEVDTISNHSFDFLFSEWEIVWG